MAYKAYRALFEHYINFVSEPAVADIAVLAHPDDFYGLAAVLRQSLDINPKLKLFVVSEEPLWDSTWQGDCLQLQNSVTTSHGAFYFSYLNYVTSSIFHFNKLPYFVTTTDDYFVRYKMLFNRNRQLEDEDILHRWRCVKRACFMAQRRTEDVYDSFHPDTDMRGLSRYRTLVAEGLIGPDVHVSGQGWTDNQRRQTLPDWHLAKLAETDQRYFLMSALENTHVQHYVSEKLFDAFAMVSLPVYYASPLHSAHLLVPEGSFINLFGYSASEATTKLKNLSADNINMAVYTRAQRQLAERFSCTDTLLSERLNLVKRVMAAIYELY